MVIIINRYGQYSNRLIQDMRIRTFCRKNKIWCLNLDMAEMEKYFSIPKTPFLLILLGKVLRRMIRYMNKFGLDPVIHLVYPYREEYAVSVKRCGIHLVDEWGLYDLEEEEKLFEKNRKCYRLKPQFYQGNYLYDQMQKWHKEGYFLVGVHIRRGDYKEWFDGKYYYEDTIYEKWIGQVSELYHNMNLKFIIFSSDQCSIAGPNIVISHNSWYVDQFLLGMTDSSFGPPSTFRRWASYIYGNKTCDMVSPNMKFDKQTLFEPFCNWKRLPPK